LRATYTYSKARGDVDNFRLTESYVPGLLDPDGDRSYQQGPSAQDVPHFLTVSGYVRAPWGINLAGILNAMSGFPYTGLVGFDADGDGVTSTTDSFGDRPEGLSRNSFRYPSQTVLDLSASKVIELPGTNRIEIRFEVFNALNADAVTQVNRVIGLDPLNPPATFGQVTQRQTQVEGQFSIRYRF
jgi:hypothetical protein